MAINYSLLRSLTARELISALARDGFVLTARLAPINSTAILTGAAQSLSPARRDI